ncbi:HK97 gp10 family phage protein [Secundilactobacillus kimchicus]|uniref:HK97 gp10 family phage protein n=1 Tax=Secundilactobacillus kimchicus TaxID=528209 RepID=UPI0006E1B043|nr:HK97 gp10 family phage protein [Secundilactobacillus kimchicus]
MKRVGVQAQRTVENVTPVDTGTLRRGWTLSSGGLMAVTLSNGVEYAPFIENGHRTRGGGGWVPGHFMLRDSIKAVESQLGSLITPQFQKVLEGML